MTEPQDLVELGDDLCLSGGAEGADLQWGMTAGAAGMSVIHWSFQGHRSLAPVNEVVILTAAQLAQADPFCQQANQSLRRRFPPVSAFTANLLRRNWYQVRDACACYAVATIKDGVVQGGTAWATQMFTDRFGGAPCPAYVFCQQAQHWFAWQAGWEPIEAPPRPSGIFAGIGTRRLNLAGRMAIRTLMGYAG